MTRSVPLVGALCLATVLVACKGDKTPKSIAPHKPTSFDTTPIAIEDFSESAKTQRRVLYMPFGEAAERLGSLELEATSTIHVTSGQRDQEQTDTYKVRRDASENVYVLLGTPVSEIEVAVVDRKVFIRQDKGHMRIADNHDFQAPSWPDIAWSSIPEALEPFRPRLKFTRGTAATTGGRDAIRYDVSLSATDNGGRTIEQMPTTSLPVGSPASWRERAQAKELTGSLWIDKATATPLKLTLSGRLTVGEKDGRVTDVELKYDGEVKNVGRVAAVSAPKAIPELRIATPPSDPVSFFRDHLAPLAPNEAP